MRNMEPYHYVESGLDNVYLQNGFTWEDSPYGETVAIEDVEGLHRAIGKSLLEKPKLTGAEFRFLRKEMQLSQADLAKLCSTTEQTLSLWERGKPTKAGERWVRLLYEEFAFGSVHVKECLKMINELDQQSRAVANSHDDENSDRARLTLDETDHVWRTAA